MTKSSASSDIIAAGLTLGSITYEYSDTVVAGLVINQDPLAGTELLVGSPVDLVVSLAWPNVTMDSGGNRLVELQNNDGGWDWPLDDGDANSGSDPNTFASPAMGLVQAYRQTADPNIQAALEKARTFLLNKTDNFTVTDGAVAVELDNMLGGTPCIDHVNINFYNKLEAGTYYDAATETTYDTNSYIQALRDSYAGSIANHAAWDVGVGLYSAHVIGANTTEWIAGVKAEIDELNGNFGYGVLGLAGAVFGLAATGEDVDPAMGQHASASSLSDLAAILTGYQLDTGGFTWHWLYMDEGVDETARETVYATLALNEFDRNTYFSEIMDAGNYLQNVQLATGGWENDPNAGEKNEITGEALRGLAMIAPQVGDFDGDRGVNFVDFAIFAQSWLSEVGDANFNSECDISYPRDDIINELDLATFVDSWLAGDL